MPVKSVYPCILLNLCCPFPQALHVIVCTKKKKDLYRVLQLVRLTARAEIRSSHLLQGNLQRIYSTVANHSLLLISILPYLTALTQPPGQTLHFSSSPSQLVYSVYSFRRAGCRAVYANCRPNFFAFSAWMARSRRWVTCCDLMPMMPAPGPGRSRRAGARQI